LSEFHLDNVEYIREKYFLLKDFSRVKNYKKQKLQTLKNHIILTINVAFGNEG
jgi:hypothetical protein